MNAKQYIDSILNEGRKSYAPGTRVRITYGSGVDSNKTGTIVDSNKIRIGDRGVPSNVQGAYKPVDWSKEYAILLDDGEYITMFKNRVIPENMNEGSEYKVYADRQGGGYYVWYYNSDNEKIGKQLMSKEAVIPYVKKHLDGLNYKIIWIKPTVKNEAKKDVKSETKEPVTAEDSTGKMFRVYNLSHNWAALIPEDGEVSDKIMISIGDFYEEYTHYDSKGKIIHTPESNE